MANATTDSLGPFPGQVPELDKLWGSIGLVVGMLTIFGNILVFCFLIRMSKRSVSDCAFVNLSVIDTISGFACIAGSWFLLDDRKWLSEGDLLHSITCYAAGMAWNAASLTTPLLVCVVSIGRLAAVYLPLRYDAIFTLPVVCTMLVYCWLHGLVASSLSLWGDSGSGKYELYREWGFCDQSISTAYKNTELSKVLYLLFFTIPMMLTCGCIIVSNLAVMVRIIRMKLVSSPTPKNKAEELEKGRRTSEIILKVRKMSRLSRSLAIHSVRAHPRAEHSISSINDADSEDSSFRAAFCTTCSHGNNCTACYGMEVIGEDLEAPNNLTVINKPAEIPPKRKKPASLMRKKTISKIKRARNENRAIFMTLLVSMSYLIFYMEIINYYTLASFTDSPTTLLSRLSSNKVVATYSNLWYYYSLFASSATNVLLHFLFNRNIRKGMSLLKAGLNFASGARILARTVNTTRSYQLGNQHR